MAADDESLLDVFVNVKPSEEILAATEKFLEDAAKRCADKFGGFHNAALAQAKATAAQLSQIQVGGPGGGGAGGGPGGGAGKRGSVDAEQFREASRAAEDLVEQSRQLNIVLKEIGSAGISQQFETAANELKRVQTEIRRNAQDNDLLGLEKTLNDLDAVDRRLREIQVASSQQRNVREQFNQVVSGEKNTRVEENIRDSLQTSLTRGLPSGEIRSEIAKARAEVKLFEAQFDALVKDFDGSAAHLKRLVEVSQKLNGTLDTAGSRSGLANIQAQAQSSSRSMNNLQNSAYQMGQAIEDAAVGFSLNGVAGAVRGSANNIAFLINDLSRVPAFQNKIGAGFAAWLPLLASVGGAVAITVLPPLIEWLESLNDIETKTKDITEELKRSFAETDFEIGIKLQESDLRRSLLESEGPGQVLDAIKKLNAEAEDGKTRIRDMMSGFEEDGGLQKTRDSVRELFSLVSAVRDRAEDAVDLDDQLRAASPAFLNNITPRDEHPNTKQLKETESFLTEIAGVVQAVEVARLNLRDGIIDEKGLEKTEKAIFDLSQRVIEFTKTADPADEKFGETLKGNLEAVNAEFQKMRDISRQVASQIGQQFDDALEIGLRKTEELRDRLDIIRSTTEGITRETALYLDTLSNVSEEYARQVNSSTLLTDDQKEAAIAIQKQTDLINLQIREVSIREQLRETEEKIEAVREKSRRAAFVSLDSYLQKLQVNALSDDPQKEQLENLMKQREQELAALAQQEVAQNRIAGGRAFGDIGVPFRDGRMAVPDPFDKRNMAGDRFIEQELIRGIFEMTSEQKKTVRAIEELDRGARAGRCRIEL